MPMIDVYAVAGTFPDKHQLAVDLAGHAISTIALLRPSHDEGTTR